MSGLTEQEPIGALREGWSGLVGDYAIAGGWLQRGDALVVADASGGVFCFAGNSGKLQWSQAQAHDGGLALAIHPNGTHFATSGQDGRILIWDATGEVKRVIDLGGGWVEHIQWSPNGEWLAATCSAQVHVYDAEGNTVWASGTHPSTVSALAWSKTNELATACYGRVSFFTVPSGELTQVLEWKGSLVSLVLSPDGDVVACGSQDNSVHFWRRSTGHDSMMAGYPCKPTALAFNEGGALLATGGGQKVTVWNFQGGGPEGTRPGLLEMHIKPVTSLAFAQGGLQLASGGRDGAVVVWSLNSDGEGWPSGAALVDDVVAQLAWRPDGRALAALDAQGRVTVWRVRQ